MSSPSVLMTASTMRLAISRVAHQIAERVAPSPRLLLLGVQKGGVHLAARLSQELQTLLGHPVPTGQIDVSLHRDDLHQRPAPPIHPTNLPGDLNDATVILADDVLSSGRTVRAALDAIHDFGRPDRVQLAVLIDRHDQRKLPVQPDYVARKIQTNPDQRVQVRWRENGEEDGVFLSPP
jgi:pyrimidine operon attenuation protein/uracil phosphoribosyltransferase